MSNIGFEGYHGAFYLGQNYSKVTDSKNKLKGFIVKAKPKSIKMNNIFKTPGKNSTNSKIC